MNDSTFTSNIGGKIPDNPSIQMLPRHPALPDGTALWITWLLYLQSRKRCSVFLIALKVYGERRVFQEAAQQLQGPRSERKRKKKKKEEENTEKRLKTPSSLEKVTIQILNRVVLFLIPPSYWYYQHVDWHFQRSRKVVAGTPGLSVEIFEGAGWFTARIVPSPSST